MNDARGRRFPLVYIILRSQACLRIYLFLDETRYRKIAQWTYNAHEGSKKDRKSEFLKHKIWDASKELTERSTWQLFTRLFSPSD